MGATPKVEAKRLKGFQDYLPEVMGARLEMMKKIREISSISGFQPVGTPALEYAEVLLGQGAETDKQMFRFQDNGGRDVGLRFDLTVPFARFVAEHQGELVFPFKRLQMGDVWRAEKPQKGRYREFAQCDLDIIGVDSIAADVEILSCLQNIMSQLECGSFTTVVGNRNILTALIRKFLPHIQQAEESSVLIALDKLEKIGKDKVLTLIGEIEGASAEEGMKLLDTLLESRNNFSIVSKLFEDKSEVLDEVSRLEKTVQLVSELGVNGKGEIKIDLSIARGLGYYTGMVFETVLAAIPSFGSVCSGGRYNQLTERFSNQELQGVGGSIGLDRLLAALQEINQLPYQQKKEVFIAVATEDAVDYGFTIAKLLREAGIRTDVSLKCNKVSAQFKLATRMGCQMIITVGGQEKENKTFSWKNLVNNDEARNLPVEDIVQIISQNLSS